VQIRRAGGDGPGNPSGGGADGRGFALQLLRHVAPGPEAPERGQAARGHDRWVVNKLRALNSWYTKGIDNGSHLRVAVNSAESIAQLRDIIAEFFGVAALA